MRHLTVAVVLVVALVRTARGSTTLCECTNCWLDTTGPCKHVNDASCMQLTEQGTCPAGTDYCCAVAPSHSRTPTPSKTPSASPTRNFVAEEPADAFVVISQNGHAYGDRTNDSPIVFTFTIAEDDTQFSLAALDQLVNCDHPAFAGSGGDFTLACDAKNGFEVGLGVPAHSFLRADGTTNPEGVHYFMVISDTTAPTVAVSTSEGNAPGCINDNPLEFRFTMSEAVARFQEADVQTQNCNDPVFTADSTTSFRLSCNTTGFEEVTVGVTVPAGSFEDTAGNLNAVGASLAMTSDTLAPSLTITSADHDAFDLVTDDPIVFTFTISEDSDFNVLDITTLEHCNNPVFEGSGTRFTLSCDANHNELVAVGVGMTDFEDCAGNRNAAGVPYFGLFSVDPSSIPASNSPTSSYTPRPSGSTWASPTKTPSPSTTPSPSPSKRCNTHSYYGPLEDTYLAECAEACEAFTTLTAAMTRCSALESCGGVTRSKWNQQDFGYSYASDVYQTRLYGDPIESPAGETSWLRQECDETAGQVISKPSVVTDPSTQYYCYIGPFPDLVLPGCVDQYCTSFIELEEAMDYCNSIDECSGVVQTEFGPASASIPYQPRLYRDLDVSADGEAAWIREVCEN